MIKDKVKVKEIDNSKSGLDAISSICGFNKVIASINKLDRGGEKDLAKNTADNLVSNVDKVL